MKVIMDITVIKASKHYTLVIKAIIDTTDFSIIKAIMDITYNHPWPLKKPQTSQRYCRQEHHGNYNHQSHHGQHGLLGHQSPHDNHSHQGHPPHPRN
jgi:hypothetical protein